MAHNFRVTDALRNAYCNLIAAAVDSGAGPGTITFFTGSNPPAIGAADSGTELVVFTFDDPAFGSPVAGAMTANAIGNAVASGSGDAGHFRCKNSTGTVQAQGTAGEAADVPDAVWNDKAIVFGGTLAATSFTITVQEVA